MGVILGITPARGGSKGIPRKNLRSLCGKPLLNWTIDAARASTLLDRFVVSTEDAEIATVARQGGAEVINRPKELATDETDTLPVLQHALQVIPADIIVLLQATSPVRSPGLVDRCIRRFLETDADSLATGFMCKYLPYGTHDLRRQDINGFFYDDGNVYVMRADLVKKGDRYGQKREHVLNNRIENIDIDDDLDWRLAEVVLGSAS